MKKIFKNWGDITIGVFQKLHNAQNGVYDFGFEREIAVLSVLSDYTVEELEAMPKDQVLKVAQETRFVNEPLTESFNVKFRIGRRRFRIIVEANKISAEQFILLNRYTANEANSIENLHYILATLTEEVTWMGKRLKYDHDFEGKAKLFQDKLSIEMAFAPSVFFCEVYKSWLTATETYLAKKAKTAIHQVKTELESLI